MAGGQTAISTVTGEEVQVLIQKLDRAGEYLLSQLPLVDLYQKQSSNTPAKAAPPKHLRQTESICNHLGQIGFLPSTENEQQRFCYLELGCGTAKLSDHLSQRLGGHCSHVLIDRKDRASFKAERLRDGAIIHRQKGNHSLRRVTADLQNLEILSEIVAEEKNTDYSTKMVVISKHLCGSAADYAIRGLDQVVRHKPYAKPLPMAVATCCHHRCEKESFSNIDFFRWLGFSERDFEVLGTVSHWFSIKVDAKNSKEADAEQQSNIIYVPLPPLPDQAIPFEMDSSSMLPLVPSEQFEREFTRAEKASLGKRCTLALDTARGHKLKQIGYQHVKFVAYTTLSLENTLILAYN